MGGQGVEENYLRVANDDYLIVTEVRQGIPISRLPSGKPDVVQAVFQPVLQDDPYVAPPVPHLPCAHPLRRPRKRRLTARAGHS